MHPGKLLNGPVIAVAPVHGIDVGPAETEEILEEGILQESIDGDDGIIGNRKTRMAVENIVSRNNHLNLVWVALDPGIPILLGCIRPDLVSQADHHDGPDQGIVARHNGTAIDGMDVLTDMRFGRDGNGKGSHMPKIPLISTVFQLDYPLVVQLSTCINTS